MPCSLPAWTAWRSQGGPTRSRRLGTSPSLPSRRHSRHRHPAALRALAEFRLDERRRLSQRLEGVVLRLVACPVLGCGLLMLRTAHDPPAVRRALDGDVVDDPAARRWGGRRLLLAHHLPGRLLVRHDPGVHSHLSVGGHRDSQHARGARTGGESVSRASETVLVGADRNVGFASYPTPVSPRSWCPRSACGNALTRWSRCSCTCPTTTPSRNLNVTSP